MEAGAVNFDWWDFPRAVGISAWIDQAKAAALAQRKGFPWLAQIDLANAHEKTPWAFTGGPGHVTIWAPGVLLIPAVAGYIAVP
jgi:hypothetical protein